jgi:hypothetical protein
MIVAGLIEDLIVGYLSVHLSALSCVVTYLVPVAVSIAVVSYLACIIIAIEQSVLCLIFD